jgi:Tol biopolymer transport system component
LSNPCHASVDHGPPFSITPKAPDRARALGGIKGALRRDDAWAEAFSRRSPAVRRVRRPKSRLRSTRLLLALAAAFALALTAFPPGSHTLTAQAAYPGLNGKIAFDSRRAHPEWDSHNSEIFIMNPDGSGVVQLTDNDADDWPVWSPDGTRIAFTSFRDAPWPGDTGDIFVMNADGSGQTNLTNSAVDDYWPAWSPDGKKIAFTGHRGFANDAEIVVMNADGSGQTNLTNNLADDNATAWSPDGTKIAFATGRGAGGTDEIFVMNADGSGQANLTNNAVHDFYPEWSPDGTKIAFTTIRNDNWELYVMNADGSSQTNLSNNPAEDSSPDWEALPLPPPVAPPPPAGEPPPPQTAAPCLVPRVVGRRLRTARTRIRRAHCSVGRVRHARSTRPRGRVIRQKPRAGARLRHGARVNIVVSRRR